MHSQLNRIEDMTKEICSALKSSFQDIKATLKDNEKGLKTLQDTWVKKVGDLETVILKSTAASKEDLEKEFHKFELKISAVLEDDCDSDDQVLEAISAQLADVKQQLVEAAVARQNGDEEAVKRTQSIIAELKGVQTQLLDVVQLTQSIKSDMDKGFQVWKRFNILIFFRYSHIKFE